MIGQPIRRIIPADRQAEEDDILATIRRGESVQIQFTIPNARYSASKSHAG